LFARKEPEYLNRTDIFFEIISASYLRKSDLQQKPVINIHCNWSDLARQYWSNGLRSLARSAVRDEINLLYPLDMASTQPKRKPI